MPDDHLALSDLAERVLAVIDRLESDQVMTYGEVAQECGTSARAVGTIMRNHGHLVEWWRVVHADGRGHPGAEKFWDNNGIKHAKGRVDWA
ncbi:MGMT family protein [Corynebacterium tapiri]|uniref:MGMT family protein n=1 Tax=Corynebacterium tapiri TaxID=1448266 RepID=A0A5C4U2R0_9CORY|nr:MGMT family protein [Corynebacterium tapiri]TNL96778.1 MGMT family protein [Corynebacterium tapiri]